MGSLAQVVTVRVTLGVKCHDPGPSAQKVTLIYEIFVTFSRSARSSCCRSGVSTLSMENDWLRRSDPPTSHTSTSAERSGAAS
jgi:hypothetical protein